MEHSKDCECTKCRVKRNNDEPTLVADHYDRKTGRSVADTLEYHNGSWIVNYHWEGYSDRTYPTAGNNGWLTVDNWNKQCLKDPKTA